MAEKNPDQAFAIIDNGSVADNVTGVNFATEQCSYLVGVAAASMTKTNNVGFVIGMVSPLMNTFGYGYYAGVLDDGATDTSLVVLLPYLCVDGINEKGVSVSILKLDVKEGETPVDQQEPGKVAIGHSVLARYILDNCATVEEAVALAKEYNIRNTGDMDFHLFVTDATGASVVLEWRYNQLTVTDTNAVTNYYVGYDDAEDRFKDGVCTEKATPLVNTVREYHYGYGHGYHRLTGIVSAVERYIDFTQ